MVHYPVKGKDTAHRLLATEAIVVNFKTSLFYNLNEVGAFIWEHCDGRTPVAEIARALTDEFEVSLDEAQRDCLEFIEGLVEQGVLLWRDSPAPEPDEEQ
jgi:hypothetical protein